jgi:hypothetical protein
MQRCSMRCTYNGTNLDHTVRVAIRQCLPAQLVFVLFGGLGVEPVVHLKKAWT